MRNIIVGMFLLVNPLLAFADGYSRGAVDASTKTDVAIAGKNQAELYHTLAEKKAVGLAEKVAECVDVSGLVELEGGLEHLDLADGTSDTSGSLIVATAQIGFNAELSDHVDADLILLYEDGESLTIDEATLNWNNGGLFGRLGFQYLPFGVFNSHFISDPLTLELGELQETALLAGYRQQQWTISIFVFSGEISKVGQENHFRDWGVSLSASPAENLMVGASFVSDLAESNAELLTHHQSQVGGWSTFLILNMGDIEISGEFVGVTKSFDTGDLDEDGNGVGDTPRAWNFELAYLAAENLEFAARYEGCREFPEQPIRQYGTVASWGAWKHISLSLEYLHGTFDRAFASDQKSRDLFTFQAAFEF